MIVRLNIRKLKGLIWLVCIGVLLYDGYTFYDVYDKTRVKKIYKPRSLDYYYDVLTRELSEDRQPRRQLGYDEDQRAATWSALVDGSVRESETATAIDTEPVEQEPEVPEIETILDVGLVLYSADPVERMVAIRYLPAAEVPSLTENKQLRMHLAEGEPLQPPYDDAPYNGRVVGIGMQKIVFAWGDGEVELTPRLGVEGAGVALEDFQIPPEDDPVASVKVAPAESREIEPGKWLLGADDLDKLRNATDTVLGEEITLRSIVSPTGGRTQLEITDVEEGSLAAQFGAQAGDRIISVNGFPMPSVPAAVNWAKANPDEPVYVVQYERGGKILTTTIYVK